jgi:hypothetical protein
MLCLTTQASLPPPAKTTGSFEGWRQDAFLGPTFFAPAAGQKFWSARLGRAIALKKRGLFDRGAGCLLGLKNGLFHRLGEAEPNFIVRVGNFAGAALFVHARRLNKKIPHFPQGECGVQGLYGARPDEND